MVYVCHDSFHPGQTLFFPIHHLLLSSGALYVVLINLKELLLPPGEVIREEWTGEKVRPPRLHPCVSGKSHSTLERGETPGKPLCVDSSRATVCVCVCVATLKRAPRFCRLAGQGKERTDIRD